MVNLARMLPNSHWPTLRQAAVLPTLVVMDMRHVTEVKFTGVNSLSCRAENACEDSTFSLARNLYCNTDSLVTSKEGPKTCDKSTFTITAGGDHCMQCLGASVCEGSDFIFQAASQVSVYCVGEPDTCKDADFELQGNSKLLMVCDGGTACAGDVDVTLGDNSEMLVTCEGSDACKTMQVTKGSGSKCKCTVSNGAFCPSGCSTNEVVDVPSVCAVDEADSACCAGSPSKNGGHPDCAECFSTTTTSTGGGGGDPHIDTFDGQHYLLLKQGSFSFWHFSGGLFAKRNGHLGIWTRFPALAHASPVTMSEDLMLK